VHLPEFVDAHADEKHDEIPIDLGRGSLRSYLGHWAFTELAARRACFARDSWYGTRFASTR
jgi:hypothetical protein